MSETVHNEAETREGGEPEPEAGSIEEPAVEGAPKPRKKKRKKRAAIENGTAAPSPAVIEDKLAPAAEQPQDAEPQLLAEGNPIRVRGLVPLLAGLLLAFSIMAIGPQSRFGVPLGALGIFAATFGVLDLLGTFDDPDSRLAKSVHIRVLAQPLAVCVSGAAALWAFVTLAVDGRLQVARSASLPGPLHWLQSPELFAAVLIPSAFLLTVVGAYRTLDALGVMSPPPGEAPRPLLRRHGFWLIVLTTLLYLPLLGSHSLSDPWETHYGEVSREILARNDWISLWWAQDGWFWSKPILDFWIQALAMATFGVRYGSDRMLSTLAEGRIPWPEWAVRLPMFLLSLGAIYLLYKAVAKVFGRRAGLFGGIVLVTMPQYFLMTHQTMTDMPFVATMAAAVGAVMLGLFTDPDQEVRVYEIDLGFVQLRVSAYHVVIGAILVCALPQILYLLSRNLEIRLSPFDLHPHADAFAAGSPGNCTLPGNEGCHAANPILRGLHPGLQALIWLQATALIVYMNWGERRLQRLFFLAAWLLCALSTMAKGPAGLGLPVLATLAYLAISRRGKDILRMEVAGGTLILLAVALPWFVAMYARHGQPFTDRLFFHDMFKRAFTHVHDTNEGDDVSFRYYVWQLGYATFPWVGLLPVGLVAWLRRSESDEKGQASSLLAMWFVISFALFSLMLTKFHHYILPAVPPAAMLIGIWLDEQMPRNKEDPALSPAEDEDGEALRHREADAARRSHLLQQRVFHIGGLAGSVLLLLVGVAVSLRAVRSGGARMLLAMPGAAGIPVIVLGVGALIATALFLAPSSEDLEPEPDDDDGQRSHARAITAAVAIGGALLVFLVGRDMASSFEGQFSQIRLVHLITYNYKRPWPLSVDVAPAIWAFAIVGAFVTGLLLVARWRRHVVPAVVGAGVLFCAWGIDVYMMKISPHWGQRETMLAYYEASHDKAGPLIAYQMNWKGENFYTGNHVPAFVSSGKRFTDYVLEQKKRGIKTFYFMLEHSRTGSLQNELGNPRVFEKLTPPELNNKFLLVRATFD